MLCCALLEREQLPIISSTVKSVLWRSCGGSSPRTKLAASSPLVGMTTGSAMSSEVEPLDALESLSRAALVCVAQSSALTMMSSDAPSLRSSMRNGTPTPAEKCCTIIGRPCQVSVSLMLGSGPTRRSRASPPMMEERLKERLP